MVPVAGVVVPLIDGYVTLVPSFFGLLAVPDSVAVSLSVLPRTHGPAVTPMLSTQVADVASVGVLGVTEALADSVVVGGLDARRLRRGVRHELGVPAIVSPADVRVDVS